MNSDKCGTHRPMQRTSAFLRGDDVLRDLQFGCTARSRADASRGHRTRRKEKPHQDNGKKPKCAKFHRSHSCRCERKAIKGCTARIVPDHSAFRKRNHRWKSEQSWLELRLGLCDILPPLIGEREIDMFVNVRSAVS